MKIYNRNIVAKSTFISVLLLILMVGGGTTGVAQRNRITPPRVEGNTPVGVFNGHR